MERLNRIEEYAQAVGEIPGLALLPSQDLAEPLDLNTLLQREIPRWCTSDVTLDVGELAVESTVFADPHWLAIVLEILTTNAIQAMKSSHQKKLSVSSKTRGRRVVIELANTGEAIPNEVCDKLFKEPIPSEEGAEGSGVGLLIARTIMRRYGGDIVLLRTGPEGTAFSLWVPLNQA
jgi:signal transduction histidine kinase